MSPLHKVNLTFYSRYLKILRRIEPTTQEEDPTSIQHLIKMCEMAIRHPEMYIDKHSNWLGYVQGIMIMRGHLNYKEEQTQYREMTRDAYRMIGLSHPKILEVFTD